ncbi:TerC family protein [uncultured Dokdonia sp.]|uniref:TerC family protein n=1 Tax=uncultured Dokdonia sp. TaxID=575653 RepID=UPI002614A41F|nr:TerC family protein [uncultured Dokdonia sp.]
MFEIFSSSDAWVALLTLTFLEIILGIDNIIFITLASDKLPEKDRKKATSIGLLLAMGMRIALLFGISYLIALSVPFWYINNSWLTVGISWQAIILFAGGIFLLWKSVHEIHEKVDETGVEEQEIKDKSSSSLTKAIVQIAVINIVFSFDSILTAVGMTSGLSPNPTDALIIMIIAVVISIIIMMLFANPVGNFINKHPSLQILGLSFLILIGFMLIAEAAHLSHLNIFGSEIGSIPKGYLYFTIAFSLLVEFLNFRFRKKATTKK